MSTAGWLILGLLAAGCGAPAPSGGPLGGRLSTPRARAAREHAPDLIARSWLAREAARNSQGPLRHDHERRAAIWLETALSETRRVRLQRRLVRLQREAENLESERARLVHERRALLGRLERAEAARETRARASRVFAQLAAGELRGRHRQKARAAASSFLLGRARLLFAAAGALGASPERLRSVHEELARLGDLPGARRARLRAAQRMLREAHRLLGQRRRAAGDEPSEAEVASLLGLARQRGLEAERRAEGVVITLHDVFSGGALGARGRRRLAQVESLLLGHPFGPLRVRVHGSAGAVGSRTAKRRARGVAAALKSLGPRLQVDDASERVTSEAVELRLDAYAGVSRPSVVQGGPEK